MSKVTRKSFKVDSTTQGELFSKSTESCGNETEPKVTIGPRVFIRPDPKKIFIGNTRLDKHLKDGKILAPLVIADILKELDWTSFEENCKSGGRASYHPQLMTGILLYGISQGVSSLRGLERFARTDLGCMWVCGGIAPDHSVLGRFATKHSDLLSDELFISLTQKILKATGSNCDSVAGDGTVVEAAASRFSMVKKEAAEQAVNDAKVKADAEPDNKKVQNKLDKAKQVADAFNHRKPKSKKAPDIKVSSSEPEAVNQPLKNKIARPSYKPSVMANEKRVIVAAEIDPSCETKVVGPMLETIEKLSGEMPEQCMLDAGYHCDSVIDIALKNDIDLLCPEGRLDADGKTKKQSTKFFPKSCFIYDENTDTYRCPANRELAPQERYQGNSQNPAYVKYGTKHCKDCPLHMLCTKSPHGRKIKRYAGDEAKEALRQVMEHPAAQKRYKKRQAWVEPVFGEMIECQGLKRFRRKGLAAVKMEFALHAMAHNLRRAVFAASILYVLKALTALLNRKYTSDAMWALSS